LRDHIIHRVGPHRIEGHVDIRGKQDITTPTRWAGVENDGMGRFVSGDP